MKQYRVKIEPDALADIQEITKWYNKERAGLGKRFLEVTRKQISSLNTAPQIYAIKYKEVRCMGITRFPYMVHFYINDENTTVEVLAVISTDRNPKLWEEKTNKP